MRQVKLEWVQVDGRVRHVSEFAHLKSHHRPRPECWSCGGELLLVLGSQVAHHARHRVAAKCAASEPESILHWNVKHYVAAQLRRGGPLLVTVSCSSPGSQRKCSTTGRVEFADGWTEVRVESSLGGRRPDVLLLKGEIPLVAIEIVVTNPVSKEKAADLANLGVPWIEVPASDVGMHGPDRWSRRGPLPTTRIAPPPSEWDCPDCLRRLAAEDHARRTTYVWKWARVVDVYRPSRPFGSRRTATMSRHLFVVRAKHFDGKATEYQLVSSHADQTLQSVKAPLSRQATQALSAAYREACQAWERQGAVLDSPMPWVSGQDFMKLHCPPRRVITRDGRQAEPCWGWEPERRSGDVKWNELAQSTCPACASGNRGVRLCPPTPFKESHRPGTGTTDSLIEGVPVPQIWSSTGFLPETA